MPSPLNDPKLEALLDRLHAQSDADEYRNYVDSGNHPSNRFRTMTVPFDGGFELSVRV